MCACVWRAQVVLFKCSDEEYESLVAPDSGSWSREETDYLYSLCEQFDLRWPVIADRYEVPAHACIHACTCLARVRTAVLSGVASLRRVQCMGAGPARSCSAFEPPHAMRQVLCGAAHADGTGQHSLRRMWI